MPNRIDEILGFLDSVVEEARINPSTVLKKINRDQAVKLLADAEFILGSHFRIGMNEELEICRV